MKRKAVGSAFKVAEEKKNKKTKNKGEKAFLEFLSGFLDNWTSLASFRFGLKL